MNLLKRLKNLWELSRFDITEFDNKPVITQIEDKLVVAHTEKSHMAQIIKLREDPVEEALKQ